MENYFFSNVEVLTSHECVYMI